MSGVADGIDKKDDDTKEDKDQNHQKKYQSQNHKYKLVTDDDSDSKSSSDSLSDSYSKSDSDSSDSVQSNDKHAAAAPLMANSKEKQGFEAVSGSGEVPVYQEDNQKHQDRKNLVLNDGNSGSKSHLDSADHVNSNHKNAAAAPIMSNKKEKQGFEAVSGSGEVPVYFDANGHRLCKCQGGM